MRKIKFRAWDKINKIMFYPVSINFFEGYVLKDERKAYYYDSGTLSWDTMELMEFVGISDRNGKEIYEGDIVKGVTYKEPLVLKTEKDIIGVVKWGIVFGNPCFYFSVNLSNGFRTYSYLLNCEVIGNIYETPELLKENGKCREEKNG